MTEALNLQSKVPQEVSSPAAPLESILCTDKLLGRPSRPPDHHKENAALTALVSALADSPRTILQTLADKVLETLDADSAGLSLLTKDGKRFYWAATAGAWKPHLGGGTPRDFGPCGDVLDSNVTMLFTHWERRYPYLSAAMPLAEEGLLVPFHVDGKAVGTIWTIAHRDHRKFDTEDKRLLESLGRFASSAYQTVESIGALKLEVAAREKAETELRELTDSLERQVSARTKELENRNLDITRRERELRELHIELARANRIATMEQLSSSIAHEVIQPIATARNNAWAGMRFLEMSPPNLGAAKEAFDHVVAEVDRAGDIIHRIKDHVKKAPPKMDRFDVNEAIRDAIMLTRCEAVKIGASIRTQLAEPLPFVRGDRVQIQQVMVNLIVNAVQAMSGDGDSRRELLISTETDEAGGARVAVRDSGPGLVPESLPRLFEPFYTTKAEGMGMGLAICRSIVEAHGGRLWATACEPHGTLFQFTIPAEQDATS
jgi:signal transduction histidine kinase